MSLTLPAFDEPLTLSGIVLGALSTSDAVTFRPDPALRSALGANPTTVRRFPTGDILAAFAEVYSDDPRTTAQDIAVSATIAAAGGKTMRSDVAGLVGASNGQPGRWGFQVEMNRPSQPVRRQIPFVAPRLLVSPLPRVPCPVSRIPQIPDPRSPIPDLERYNIQKERTLWLSRGLARSG